MSTENKPKKSLAQSVGVVAAGTAFSRVSGLLREQVMAYFFGAGMATDAFVTAFRIPNLLRDLFAEGALSSSFVPVFKDRLVHQSDKEAFQLADIVITAMMAVLGIVTLLGIAATPAIIYITANGYTHDAVKFGLTVNLTRIMWVFLPLVSISALVMGMLNSFEHFGLPAMSSAMFNVGSIVTVVLLYQFFDTPVYTLAIGVVIGGIGQIAVQIPSLWKIGYRFHFRLNLFDEGMKKMLKLFTPMMIGLSAGRINILVNTLLVSFLVEGSISYLNYAYRLMHFPLGVFAVALGTVALPRASELASKGDIDGLSKTFHETLNLNFFLTIPSAFVLAVLGRDLVELVYRHGAFSETHAANTALALLHYSYGLVGFAAVRTTVPVYYALGDARQPMKFSIFSVLVNMALYWPLMKLMNFAGLAAATSIAGLVNFGLLIYYLPSKGIPVANRSLLINLIKITVASAVAVTVAWLLPMDMVMSNRGLWGRLVHSLVPLTVAGAIYIGLCLVMGIHEVTLLKRLYYRLRGKM
ncbi:MAG TPA: murein biosynthesis integral membrane protein MurJ [Candidatus Acidoferrum sp.]|nr:murein biosynthesis integral membrane protein MurJ [Candidatus Acidoferrum sp.]